jgi:hypothetical protein
MLKQFVRNLMITTVLALSILALLSLILKIPFAEAQNGYNSMQALFEHAMDNRLSITITFIRDVELVDVFTVPETVEQPTGGTISSVIHSVGNDHVCFQYTLGGTRIIECVPFTNIASVEYFVN